MKRKDAKETDVRHDDNSDESRLGFDAGDGIDGKDDRPSGVGDGTSDGGSRGSDGDGGASAGNGGDGGSDSGERVGDGVGNSVGSSGASGNDGDATGEPSGEPVKRRVGRPRGSGRNRSRSSAGDGNANGSAGNASGLFGNDVTGSARSVNDGPEPKKVNAKDLGLDDDFADFTKDQKTKFLASILTALFQILASSLRQEHWNLVPKEATDLAKAMLDLIGTLPKKQRERILKATAQYAPLFAMATTLGAIAIPRMAYSYELREHAGTKRTSGNRAGSSTTSAGTDAGSRDPDVNFDGSGMGGAARSADASSYFGNLFG